MLKKTLVFVRNVTKNGLLLSVAIVAPVAEKENDLSFTAPKEEKRQLTGWDRVRLMYSVE